MRLALREARKGLGRTSPNPCVGAVLVRDGQVIARGFHRRAGAPHAEVEALNRAAGQSVAGATIYVTLEPCNHTGRTPPCTRAIVAAGISRVVVGMCDPNPLVAGSGIRALREQGLEVRCGVLEEQCRRLNRPFCKHITSGLPWVIMKAGVSLDGRLNYRRGASGWMTGPESQVAVHRLRDRVDAILVGRGTVAIDNPSLTTRLPGRGGRDPLRVVVDSHLSLPLAATLFQQHSPAPTFVFCAPEADPDRAARLADLGVRVWPVERTAAGLDLRQVLRILGGEGLCSLLVEGGSAIHGSFLRAALYDYAHLFIAPLFAGNGGEPLVGGLLAGDRAHAPHLRGVELRRLGEDLLLSGEVVYSREEGGLTGVP